MVIPKYSLRFSKSQLEVRTEFAYDKWHNLDEIIDAERGGHVFPQYNHHPEKLN